MFGSSYKLTRVWGIPIRVHITLVLLLPVVLLGLPPSQWLAGLLVMVGVFGSIALHELGHSLVAIRRGYRVREITLLPIGGLALMDRAPERSGDELAIALAGPGVSLALAALFRLLATALGGGAAPGPGGLALLLARLNLVLAFFNLLPSFPMDGGRVYRAWLTPFFGRLEATRRAARLGRFLALVFGIWSLLHFRWLNVAIAVFIYQAAGAEYRAVAQQATMRNLFGPEASEPSRRVFSENDADVYVSPPPYARAERHPSLWRRLQARIRRVYDDLL